MKAQRILLLGILITLAASVMQAQNSLPDPHNDSCWSSLSALRACQLQADQQAQDYQYRCTSYPEYQCNDYYEPSQKTVAKSGKHAVAPASNAPTGAAISSGGPSANLNTVSSGK